MCSGVVPFLFGRTRRGSGLVEWTDLVTAKRIQRRYPFPDGISYGYWELPVSGLEAQNVGSLDQRHLAPNDRCQRAARDNVAEALASNSACKAEGYKT